MANTVQDADALPNVFIMLVVESNLKDNGYSTKTEAELVSSVVRLREASGIWIISNPIADIVEHR